MGMFNNICFWYIFRIKRWYIYISRSFYSMLVFVVIERGILLIKVWWFIFGCLCIIDGCFCRFKIFKWFRYGNFVYKFIGYVYFNYDIFVKDFMYCIYDCVYNVGDCSFVYIKFVC